MIEIATPASKRTSDDRQFLETYGAKADFMDRDAIEPILDYVRSI